MNAGPAMRMKALVHSGVTDIRRNGPVTTPTCPDQPCWGGLIDAQLDFEQRIVCPLIG